MRSRPGRLTLGQAAQLAGWKVMRAGRHAVDRLGGNHRLAQQGQRWGTNWLAEYGGDIQGWLARRNAGEWWFDDTPAAWARGSCQHADLRHAEAAARGEFDLIGSGPVQLGTVPAWRKDLYSAFEWPLEPSSNFRLVRAGGSDIRTVWELSRCYHFIPLARAWHQGGDSHFAESFARHALSFEDQNPPGLGPHWASPMDVAIRCANWCLAVPLFSSASLPPQFWARFLGQLWLSGRFLERHLEWHPVYRGNHFVANLVGLAYLGTLFRGYRSGERWLRLAGKRLPQELAYQVGEDGVSFESALAYHRLDTELFAWAGELLRRNLPDFDCDAFDGRLRQMSGFIGAYLQPDGRAPMIGDSDDGRLHMLVTDADPRRHSEGLPARYAVPPCQDGAWGYPEGGFYVLRHGTDHAVVRCGAVGLKGAGSHDHNDQLGFELAIGGRRIVADSGTFAYTRDLSARYAFRATAAHSVVQLGNEEQNPIAPGRPWRMLADRTRARALTCEAGADAIRFRGEHSGYSHLGGGAVCRRELRRERANGTWHVVDEVTGVGEIEFAWRLHLARLRLAGAVEEGAVMRIREVPRPGVIVSVEVPPGCVLRVTRGRASDAYGTSYERPVIEVVGRIRLPVVMHCSIEQEQP